MDEADEKAVTAFVNAAKTQFDVDARFVDPTIFLRAIAVGQLAMIRHRDRIASENLERVMKAMADASAKHIGF